MGKSFKGKTLLNLVPVAIIFFLGAVLLNSCGQGNPAGSQTGTTAASTPQKSTPASTIPIALSSPPSKVTLANASGSATITWNSYPGATAYNLYYSNTPDFANSSKVSGVTSPYIFPFADRQKDYYFFVTAGNGTSEQRISGDFASLYRNGTRFKMIHPMDPIYRLLKKQKHAAIFDLMERAYAEVVYGNSILYTGGHLTSSFINQYAVNNETFFGIDCIQQQGSGGYIEYYAYGNYIAPNGSAVIRGGLTAGTFIGSAKYRYTDTGGYEYLGEEPSFAHIGIDAARADYDNDAPPLGSYFVWAWSSNDFCNSANECGVTTPSAILQVHVSNRDLVAHQIAPYDSEGPQIYFDLTISGITVSPSTATAYLHPTPTPVKFTAKDSNNVDVTSTARWTVEPTATTPPVTIANISAGLATPLKPGEASVTAALLDGSGNVTASGQATLYVQCRNYTQYMQAFATYSGNMLDHSSLNNTIGTAGCALTATTMLLSGANFTPRYDPGTLNSKYNENYDPKTQDSLGFYGSANIKWWAAAKSSVSQGKVTYNGVVSYNEQSFITPLRISDLDFFLDNCFGVIVGVRQSTHPNDAAALHYVLAIGRKGNKHLIYDPGTSRTTLEDYGDSFYAMYVYSFND